MRLLKRVYPNAGPELEPKLNYLPISNTPLCAFYLCARRLQILLENQKGSHYRFVRRSGQLSVGQRKLKKKHSKKIKSQTSTKPLKLM